MNFKKAMVGSLIGAGMLASPSAFAGFTGNVGVFSEYLFRGITQGGSAAVQGGLDYSHDSGLYVGTWASNIGFAGQDFSGSTNSNSAEMDLYGGYAGKIGGLGYDVGAIYYWYSEEDELDKEYNTFEVYAGLTYGPVAVKYFYADEANFFLGDGDADEAAYLLGALALPITESLSFTASVGFYDGDEIEALLGEEDSYTDYSVGLAKTLEGGFTFTLVLADTDINITGWDDEPQVVIGLKKSFEM